jgi:hypothetical protein
MRHASQSLNRRHQQTVACLTFTMGDQTETAVIAKLSGRIETFGHMFLPKNTRPIGRNPK